MAKQVDPWENNTCLKVGSIGLLFTVMLYGAILLGAWLVLK